MYGSVFGDACGSPFELIYQTPLKKIISFFESRLSGGNYNEIICNPVLKFRGKEYPSLH